MSSKLDGNRNVPEISTRSAKDSLEDCIRLLAIIVLTGDENFSEGERGQKLDKI
jgi:hypothetical protein